MQLKSSTRKQYNKIKLPVVIDREGNWFVARVPMLDLATQGRTLKEVKKNVTELLNLYFENPHTPKPQLQSLSNLDAVLTTVTVNVPKGVVH